MARNEASSSRFGAIARTPLEYITIPAQGKHTATVIWLHGLGDTGEGMAQLAKDMASLPGLNHIKWIAPHARSMAVTGNRGAVMPSWFDCFSFDIPNRAEDEAGLHKAVALINDLITIEEDNNIPSNRIIVGGLSQGSAVSLLLGLTTQRPIAGVFVLSGYVPLRKKTKEVEYQFSIKAAETLASDLDIPFNGSLERLVPEDLASHSTTPGLRFLTYPWLGHSVNDTEMSELAVWFSKYLPAL